MTVARAARRLPMAGPLTGMNRGPTGCSECWGTEKASPVYANEALVLARHPGTVKIKLQALRIGGFGITANPCESFAHVGLDIKQQSPFKLTMNIGLANGYSGYLPTPEQHELGGYETWPSRWSFLEVNASRKITKTIAKLLKEVAQ